MTRPLRIVSGAVQSVLVGLVKGYRLLLSPWLGASCRFAPSCSLYAIEALERHGPLHGSYLTLSRLARCHPFCQGGIDPVPERRAPADTPRPEGGRSAPSRRLFSRLLSPPSQKTFHE